jgi:Skp family chaperone for outer membrane proteins
MKTVRTLAAIAIFAAIAALPGYAQGTRPTSPATTPTRPATSPAPTAANVAVPDSKIAFINTEAFGDEKDGIRRYVNTVQSLQRELKPKEDEVVGLQNRLRQLATDIDTLRKAPTSEASVQAKQDEGARVQRELEYKQKDLEALSQKRYREIVGPVSVDIGKELDAFRKDNNLTMILDVTKLLPAILSAKDEMDITRPFIAYYNAKNPVTASAPAPK